MGAQASTAAGALDRLKDAACHRGPASKRARTLGNAGERKLIYTARFYDAARASFFLEVGVGTGSGWVRAVTSSV